MITVHHLNNSRSQRILWLLGELEVPYEIIKYQRTEQQRAPPELLAISPLGKAPVITDGDVNLAESGAIVEYLILKYGNGKATATESGYLDNLYFTHYAEGSLMPILIQKMVFDYVANNAPFMFKPLVKMIFGQLDKQLVAPEIARNLTMIEAHLEKSKSIWFAGGQEPTAADYQMVFPLEAIVAASPSQVGPKVKEYVETVHKRAAYKEALAKGGPYSYAKL